MVEVVRAATSSQRRIGSTDSIEVQPICARGCVAKGTSVRLHRALVPDEERYAASALSSATLVTPSFFFQVSMFTSSARISVT